jgi:hypothetical protein
MTADRADTRFEPTTAAGVRVCERCGRSLPAQHKDEYTPERARLVTTAGFCVCPTEGPNGVAPIPDHGPSLM